MGPPGPSALTWFAQQPGTVAPTNGGVWYDAVTLNFTTSKAAPVLDIDVSGTFAMLVIVTQPQDSNLCFCRVLVDGQPITNDVNGDVTATVSTTVGPDSRNNFAFIRRTTATAQTNNAHVLKVQLMRGASTSNRCGVSSEGSQAIRVRVTER